MKYRILIEQADDGWLAAHAESNPSVHTQGKTLDEIVENLREVVILLTGEAPAELELIVPCATVATDAE